ncbi:MAG: hypothetical protein A2Z20_10815 [Bdellovibrionales bacterium RBG_16_40_8]|nr:MAG: hypothetical protein A2Z20_10815 [Bdellovibrionales bacterium RBG_16_40_8]
MRHFIIVLVISLQIISFATFAGNTKTNDSKACSELLSEIQKPEVVILSFALANHQSVHKLSLEQTQQAVVEFINIIDPMSLTLLQNEFELLSNLSAPELSEIDNETFRSTKRDIFQMILYDSIARYNHLIAKFSKNIEYRKKVFLRAREIASKSNQKNNIDLIIEKRPSTIQEAEDKFIDIMAITMLQIESTNISERHAFVLAIREMRSTIWRLATELDEQNIPLTIAKSYIKTLDPHSDFHLLHESADLIRRMSSDYVGVGLSRAADIKGYRIIDLVPNGAAAEAGLKVGDIITHVTSPEIKKRLSENNKSSSWIWLRNISSDSAVNIFAGKENSEINLRVLRDNITFDVSLKRKRIELASSRIQVEVVDSPGGPLARVSFDAFYHEVSNDLRKALSEVLSKNNIVGVALDLRNNGGGVVDEVPKILGLFIADDGAAITSVDKDNKKETLPIDHSQPVLWGGPLVVVTNSFSASASESLAGAFQDYDRAIIIGNKTSYGKGSMQSVMSVGEGLLMRLTTGLVFTPSGRSAQKTGIVSDIILPYEVSRPMKFERDYAGVLSAALIENFMGDGAISISNKGKVIEDLSTKSQFRRSRLKNAKSSSAAFDKNTEEIFQILQDLIAALKP